MAILEFVGNQRNLIKLSRQGIEKSTFQEILSNTGFTLAEICEYLDISPRSVQHKKSIDRFSKDTSAKLYAIAKLYARGKEVFGDESKLKRWMDTENYAIGGVKPKSYLDLIEGINLVMDELVAIEHGFSA
ncbi:MAG: MbcA/ParS/Xre antitoxin family protein [Salinivirgaceae bacterium]